MLAWRHMKASTRLVVLAVLFLAACGDDGGPADPSGEWRLTGVSGVSAPVNGALVLDKTNGAGGYAALQVPGGRPDFATIAGGAGAFTVQGGSLQVGGDTFTIKTSTATTLELTDAAGVTSTYERLDAAPATSIQLAGKASIEAGAPVLDTPRVALLTMLRGTGGQGVKFLAVPAGAAEPGIIDAKLPDGFGAAASDSADFSLSRSEGALGVERIAFGTMGFASVNLVVAYEDRDHDGKLSRFDLDDCTAEPGKDCIRGVSPLLLGERDGDSPELQAAGYGLMRSGWALGAVVADARASGRVTIVPLDPTTAVPVDVKFAANPATVKYPALKF